MDADRALGGADGVGDFTVTEIAFEAKEEDFTLLGAEDLEGGFEARDLLFAVEVAFGDGVHSHGVGFVERFVLAAGAIADVVAGEVGGDAEEPPLEGAGLAQGVEALPGFEEGALGDVSGVVMVSEHPNEGVVEGLLKLLNQLSKSVEISPLSTLYTGGEVVL